MEGIEMELEDQRERAFVFLEEEGGSVERS